MKDQKFIRIGDVIINVAEIVRAARIPKPGCMVLCNSVNLHMSDGHFFQVQGETASVVWNRLSDLCTLMDPHSRAAAPLTLQDGPSAGMEPEVLEAERFDGMS